MALLVSFSSFVGAIVMHLAAAATAKRAGRALTLLAEAPTVRPAFPVASSPLLAATWLGDEILVAENPWLAIARQQTVSAVARRKYGV